MIFQFWRMVAMLQKRAFLILTLFMISLLAACGSNDATEDENGELKMLEVDFDVPETADVGETIQLAATVTYGDDAVVDADEVDFEIWEMCDKDNSIHDIPQNNEDGTYTLDYTFEQDGIYEVYAHTTAHDIHTMPKRQITVGAGGEYDCEDTEDDEHDGHEGHDDDGDHMDHEDDEDTDANDEE